jgi:hypothetical protein
MFPSGPGAARGRLLRHLFDGHFASMAVDEGSSIDGDPPHCPQSRAHTAPASGMVLLSPYFPVVWDRVLHFWRGRAPL